MEIYGYIGGALYRLTLDTGAQFNVMSPQVARASRLEVWPTHTCYKGVDCVPRNAAGFVNVNMTVHGFGVLTELLIIDDQNDAHCQIVLGMPWLCSVGGIINTNDFHLSIERDAYTRIHVPVIKVAHMTASLSPVREPVHGESMHMPEWPWTLRHQGGGPSMEEVSDFRNLLETTCGVL